jgi:Na+-transporting NADH:ubiquinone oxidoreductase subunit C
MMKNQLKLFAFVIILGTLTSLLLLGMDLITRDRIAANAEALLKSSILDANAVSYNFTNIHDIFEGEVEIVEAEGLTFYVHKTSGNISYAFAGGGIWGPIEGIITLAPDFETIVAIKILQQEETPGLGGVVAEPRFLAQFVGKKMTPELIIAKNPEPNADNEVDAITGATGTSNRFSLILNTSYTEHKAVWDNLS